MTFDPAAIRAILFDLDGTLIDSQQDIADAANAIRQSRGMEPLGLALIASFIGDGIESLVRKAMGADFEAHIDALVEEFRGHYHENCVRHTAAYAGVGHTLQLLHSRGYAMAVVTNKPERISVRILELLGMSGYFGCVIGGNTCARKKPHPEPLQEACRRLGMELPQACMVGDSRVDIESGTNAGIPSLGILGGIGDEALMRAAGPSRVLTEFSELATIFTGAR